jgi:hypothetical protein
VARLKAEMERHLAEKVSTIPELRRRELGITIFIEGLAVLRG